MPDYTNQVIQTAWKSDGKTYFDLAVEVGEAKSVNPALLVAHMVKESQIGLAGTCIPDAGKSALTGCGWYPDCSLSCECDNVHVVSDENQVICTANSDLYAYRRAKFGENIGNELYETNCYEHNSDANLMWKCIFCTYQGNFNSDLDPNDGDDRFFKREFTCEYAEFMKNEFCNWVEYFKVYAPAPATCDDGIQNGDEEGIDCGGSCPTECTPTCDDGIRNGDEDGIDCGGSCPSGCSLKVPPIPRHSSLLAAQLLYQSPNPDVSVPSVTPGPNLAPFCHSRSRRPGFLVCSGDCLDVSHQRYARCFDCILGCHLDLSILEGVGPRAQEKDFVTRLVRQ